MVAAVTKALFASTNMSTFSVIIPDCFETVSTKDANIEIIVSNHFLNVKLVYEHHVAMKTLALVIAGKNEFSKQQDSVDKKVQAALHFLKEILKFDEVRLVVKASKREIIEALDNLQNEAEDFNNNHKDTDILLTAVISIGEGISYETDEPNQGELADDGSRFLRRFFRTSDNVAAFYRDQGEAMWIALTEYTLRLSALQSVHCL